MGAEAKEAIQGLQEKLGLRAPPTGEVLEEKIVSYTDDELFDVRGLVRVVVDLIEKDGWTLSAVHKFANLVTFYLLRPSSTMPACPHCLEGGHHSCTGLAYARDDSSVLMDKYGRPEICRCACRGQSSDLLLKD